MLNTYLDVIPDELIPNIAKFFKGINVYRDALSFAHHCGARRLGIMEALEYRIQFHERDSDIFQALLVVFGDILRELLLKNVERAGLLSHLPHLPSLRKASLLATNEQLQVIRHSPGLVSIDLKLMHTTNWRNLASTFAFLPLSELTLQIERTKNRPCKHQQARLAATLPNLKSLDIHGLGVYKRFWIMITKLPSLQSLGFVGMPEDNDQLAFLKTLAEIRLLDEHSIQPAVPISQKVTKLSLCYARDNHDIRVLGRFPNLRELYLGMKELLEIGLVGKTQNVEVLELGWRFSPKGNRIESTQEDVAAHAMHYTPSRTVLLKIFESTPKLRVLFLTNASVRSDLLDEILKIIGVRLEGLTIRMNGQGESRPVRLAAVLTSLATWCPNIRELHLVGPAEGIVATAEENHNCLVEVARVRRNCKDLSIANILRYIRNFVPLHV